MLLAHYVGGNKVRDDIIDSKAVQTDEEFFTQLRIWQDFCEELTARHRVSIAHPRICIRSWIVMYQKLAQDRVLRREITNTISGVGAAEVPRSSVDRMRR